MNKILNDHNKKLEAFSSTTGRGDDLEVQFYKFDSFNISRKKLIHSSIPSRHYHEEYEILYLISGELYYFIEDRTYQFVSGVLLVINSNDIHRLFNPNGSTFERVTILFKKEFLSDFVVEDDAFDLFSCFHYPLNALKLDGPEQQFLEGLLNKLIDEDTKAYSGVSYYRKLLLIEILIFINRKMSNRSNDYVIESNHTHKRISEIVNYINHHYFERLSLTDVSTQFHISSSYLSRIFKNTTGFTFVEYVNNIRIKEAITLLRESQLTISEVSETVGFESLTHFGRVFKMITGCSPLKYRQDVVY